jgi:hypothetical protein
MRNESIKRKKNRRRNITTAEEPYEQKYDIKRRLNKEQAATIFQRQFKKKQQEVEKKRKV